MIIAILLFLLFLSFSVHIFFLVKYVTLRNKKYLMPFINTAVSNIVIAIVLMFFALSKPELIRQINVKFLFWLLSGLIMICMLLVQILMFRRAYKRSKDPQHFHLNFFGKKVLHPSILKMQDVILFFMTIPVFLLSGAFFIAKLINVFFRSMSSF